MSLFLAGIPLLALNWTATSLFFLSLFPEKNYGIPYLDPRRFFFVSRALIENPHLVALLVIWLALGIQNKLRDARWFSGLLLLALIALYPDKLPFFVCAQTMLFLFVSAPLFVERRWSRVAVGVLGLFSVINGVHWVSYAKRLTNDNQKRIEAKLNEALRPYPGIRVVDSIGIPVQDKLPGIFLGPGDINESLQMMKWIKEAGYEVIIETNKIHLSLEPLVSELNERFIEIADGVYVRSQTLEIANPKEPGAEILKMLKKDFSQFIASPDSRIAVYAYDESSKGWRAVTEAPLSEAELISLPALCHSKKCETLRVRVTPFATLMALRETPNVTVEFAFDRASPPRVSLLERWF